MKRVGFYYDDIFLQHKTPLWHPETSIRLVHIVNSLKQSEIWNLIKHYKPPKASLEDVSLIHTADYIKGLLHKPAGHLDPDTYFSSTTLEAALHAVGAVKDAIYKIKDGEIDRSFCAVRPPGHHALPHRAMGFCIFNNIAIGARYAQKLGYQRVFIVDFDVHHGNGTQDIFEEDDEVFYFSTHQYPHYPGTGSEEEKGTGKGLGYTCNIPVNAGAGDKTYGKIYNEVLPKLMQDFKPNLVLVSAGYDLHKHDPLSATRVSNEGIRSIVRGIVANTDNPIVVALEGGYNIPALEDSVKITIEELLNS
ncbi:MAG: histone deacetylase [Thermodesulfovibrionales bacterium]|nr:histone deacetylase [Thermodesulfovibrionales bacterium]